MEKGPCQGGSELQGQRLSVPLETAVMEDLFHSWLVQVFQLIGYLAQRCHDRKEVAGETSEPSPTTQPTPAPHCSGPALEGGP